LDEEGREEDNLDLLDQDEDSDPKEGIKAMALDELEIQLSLALNNEDYELASKIRDEINKRTS
jgi:hypothetical protein